MTPSPINPFDFTLQRNAFGRLVLTLASGEQHAGVVPVRAFPFAAPNEGLSLVNRDGQELVWIDDFNTLPADLKILLDNELASREFMPQIQRIQSVSTYSTPSIWQVQTDRGPTNMVLKGEEDIRRLGASALLITSGQGVTFKIPDVRGLDRHSRRLLERFL